MAWIRIKASVCSSCGTDPNSWIDEEGKIKDDEPLEVASIRCIGCERLVEAQKEAPPERRYIWHWRFPKRRKP